MRAGLTGEIHKEFKRQMSYKLKIGDLEAEVETFTELEALISKFKNGPPPGNDEPSSGREGMEPVGGKKNEIKKLIGEGWRSGDIAKKLGVHASYVSHERTKMEQALADIAPAPDGTD